jgi:phosphoribosylamine--glycine ligase
MTPTDKKKEVEIANWIFKALNRGNNTPELRGIPFYLAFVHTGKGLKILENNSRPGDPEIQNLLPIMKDDFIDVCLKMIDGTLTQVEFEKMSTVVTYKVPPTYGGFWKVFPQRVDPNDVNKPIELNEAYKLVEKHGNKNRVFPGSMELRENGRVYTLGSRTVCVVGVGEDIETARKISVEGIKSIRGGSLWYRTDIASKDHIKKSVDHMKKLRQLG